VDSKKLRGMVDGFIELNEKRCLANALMRMESQEDNSIFIIIDYRSKRWISVRIAGRLITGRRRYHLPPQKSCSKIRTFHPVTKGENGFSILDTFPRKFLPFSLHHQLPWGHNKVYGRLRLYLASSNQMHELPLGRFSGLPHVSFSL
jgi:hypothetical protein